MMNIKTVLQTLRDNVESKEIKDGEIWGMVYLLNVGNTREFAGYLSGLAKLGVYRKIDSEFGEVLL